MDFSSQKNNLQDFKFYKFRTVDVMQAQGKRGIFVVQPIRFAANNERGYFATGRPM